MGKDMLGSLELDRIYQFNCIEGIKLLPHKSIGAVVTSPPYNLGGDFHTMVDGKRVTYGDYHSPYKDNLGEEEYQHWQTQVLDACYDVLKDDGFMFYNHKNRIVRGLVISPHEWLVKSKFNVSQVVVMNLKSTANVDKRRFFPVHEFIYVLTKNPGLKLNNYECLTDVWDMKKVPRKLSGHPATFHEELPRRCIVASTQEGEIVLDPFMGSGTTALSALKTNRRFIGFELSQEYIEIANKRLVAAYVGIEVRNV